MSGKITKRDVLRRVMVLVLVVPEIYFSQLTGSELRDRISLTDASEISLSSRKFEYIERVELEVCRSPYDGILI